MGRTMRDVLDSLARMRFATATELAEDTGRDRNTVGDALRRLELRGAVRRGEDVRWWHGRPAALWEPT